MSNKKVGPIVTFKRVEPINVDTDEFMLDSSELQLFDCIAGDHVRAIGLEIEYYSLSTADSKRDALYDEPGEFAFKGPWVISANFEYDGAQPTAQEEGKLTEATGKLWIARKELEDHHAPSPNEGDVIRMWDNPHFNIVEAVDGEAIPGSGFYFDVINVDPSGYLFDNHAFVGFALDLKRRTVFTPERKISPKGSTT